METQDETLFATVAWLQRKFRTRPVGTLSLSRSTLSFAPVDMPALAFTVDVDRLRSARPAMLGTWLRLDAAGQRHDIFFVRGGEWDQRAPASWDISGEIAEHALESAGTAVDSAATLRLIPDLPFGDLLKAPSAVSGMLRARAMVTAWIAAIDRTRS